MVGKKKAFWYAQILGPMLPLPLGCWFLYKALKSFNRSPPPIATDRTVDCWILALRIP